MERGKTRPSSTANKPTGLNPTRIGLPTRPHTGIQDQLIDSLTAHISLYHSRSSPPRPNPNPNSNRALILKWFSSLTVHQRLAYLTTVDRKSTQLLIKMAAKVRSDGSGRFIALPDLPDGDLPGLCFKRSLGLLARVAESDESERILSDSVRLFGSREGEDDRGCSSCSVKFLDTMTVGEELVEDVGRFFDVMDGVSGGDFLRGEDGELGAEWVELEWLKGRGYYSIGAFVANRLEVGLRLSWMSCCGSGKKRGVRLKDKVAGAGVAANVFWRKKGYLDWWQGLGEDTRRKVLIGAIGKAAKSLIPGILKETANVSGEDSMLRFPLVAGRSLGYANSESLRRKNRKFSDDSAFCLASRANSTHGRRNSFDIIFDKLSVLQDVVELMSPCWYREFYMSKIFFSSLDSISDVADCILRRLRGLLMVISMDCMKLELLGEGKGVELPKRSSGKPVAGSRKKKRKPQTAEKLKTKLPNDVNESSFDRSDKACNGKIGFADLRRRDGITDEISSCSAKMEQSQVLILGKEKSMTKKNRKGKQSRSRCKNSDKLRESEEAVKDSACPPLISLNELSTIGGESDCSIITGISSKQKTVTVSQSSSSSSTERSKYNFNGTDTQHQSNGCGEGVGHVNHNFHTAGRVIVDQAVILKVETSKSMSELSDGASSDVLACEAATTPTGGGSDSGVQSIEEKSIKSDKFVKTVEWNGKSTLTQLGKTKIYKSGLTSPTPCLSYEWPSSVPLYFQSLNSHMLPAADRLHLDVGHNWHNSIHQPYVRTSRSEGGRSRMLSRPLPVSLDWPPIVRNASGFSPSLACNYDSELISRRKTALPQNFSAHGAQKVVFSAKTSDDERKFSGDSKDLPEEVDKQELMDDYDCQWMSEEELEMHAVPGMDYSQYFGGGAMYWNTSDQPGSGFSRPPSLSSDDSLWAWHEADMNRAVDDMLAISSSYSTNGLSPPSTSFCSPFDSMGSGHQALGYVVAGNEVSGNFLHAPSTPTDSANEEDVSGSLNSLSGNIEGRAADSLYPILRPIIIPTISKRNHGPQSPCITTSRHEQSRMKRPPSPVVLCVPRAPRLPPPSSVSDSRKHRGFPNVRSGSSSPRQWGMRSWYPDRTNVEEACLHMDGPEVVWSPWRNKNLSATHTMIQPLTGALLQDHHFAMSQLARDQEHPDVSLPLQPPDLENCSARKASLCLMHSILHKDIELFCSRVAAENLARKPFINWAVKRVARSLQVLWPRSRTNIFGSNATGLSLPTSDVDLVVSLPPVRNLEPIKEAGILEGRNGIKETCLQHAARYLANQEWVKNDSLRTVENTAIPLIMLVVDVPYDLVSSACNIQSAEEPSCVAVEQDGCSQPDAVGLDDTVSPTFSWPNCNGVKDVKSIRIDISFKSPSHTGLQTTELVKALTEQFPAAAPLALVLKQFLADRSLDQSYSGGLSSYCLVLLVTRFLQHEHHLGRPINKIFGGLLMDFLYFFGNVFDPRRMRISVQGSGTYINRERGYSIDPLYIDDPLFPTNNVGRNCFRIHQCIKAFSEAYSTLENEIANLDVESDEYTRPYRFLSKIVPNTLDRYQRLVGRTSTRSVVQTHSLLDSYHQLEVSVYGLKLDLVAIVTGHIAFLVMPIVASGCPRHLGFTISFAVLNICCSVTAQVKIDLEMVVPNGHPRHRHWKVGGFWSSIIGGVFEE